MSQALQQEQAKAQVKAALLGLLIAHGEPVADTITATVVIDKDGDVHGDFDLTVFTSTREIDHAMPVAGGSL